MKIKKNKKNSATILTYKSKEHGVLTRVTTMPSKNNRVKRYERLNDGSIGKEIKNEKFQDFKAALALILFIFIIVFMFMKG